MDTLYFELIEQLKKHEGFGREPYPDPIHGWDVPTFGYGFTFIEEEEAEKLLHNRVRYIKRKLHSILPFFKFEKKIIKHTLVEMAYQMGVSGLLSFQKMLTAIENKNYTTAYEEALNSKWAVQTPKRAKRVAAQLLKGNCI